VFGDRKGAAGNAFDTRPSPPESLDYSVTQPRRAAGMRSAPERFVRERSVPERSVSERSIPEESRVRSLNDMPLQTQDRWSEPVARQRRVAPERQERQPPQRFVEQTSNRPLANDAGPEVIRYSDFETYVTEDGDTLQTISESFFGTPEYYFDLYLANRNVLINPATVSPGTKLRIPNLTQ